MSRVAKVHLPAVGFGGIECENDLPAIPGNSKLPRDFMGSKREDLVHFARLAIYEVRLALIVENKSAAVRKPVCPLAKWREPLVRTALMVNIIIGGGFFGTRGGWCFLKTTAGHRKKGKLSSML